MGMNKEENESNDIIEDEEEAKSNPSYLTNDANSDKTEILMKEI